MFKRDAISFVFLQRLIYVMCLMKCPSLAKMPCFESWMPLVNRCINCALFNAVPNVYLHNWKEWVMQQTKYCNNVVMTSRQYQEEYINKQTKIHETDATWQWHETCYSHYMNVKVYSWPLTFRKVVRQQIWSEMIVLIPASSTDPFWI